jgi:diaminopropionate ammonia-lyase
LIKLNKLSKKLKLKEIYYKDESKRFHLKSFKALGGAFAVNKIANGKKKITVSTATAGNHGRSVAWGAKRLGLKCKIFISENVSESRAKAMRKLGARVIKVKGNYDNSLRECIKQSKKNNWEIVQDVSWKNYDYVPQLIMAGYCVMVKEIFNQLKNKSFTHVFLQAGVGGMAAAVIAGIAKYSKKIPKIIIVEPDKAECVLKSIKKTKPVKIKISEESIMGGMSCGEVSKVPWNILKTSANYCVSISDKMVGPVMSSLSKKTYSNVKIEGGECATPGIIALNSIYFNLVLKNKMKLNNKSKVLIFGCEGATDKKMYKKLIKQK